MRSVADLNVIATTSNVTVWVSGVPVREVPRIQRKSVAMRFAGVEVNLVKSATIAGQTGAAPFRLPYSAPFLPAMAPDGRSDPLRR